MKFVHRGLFKERLDNTQSEKDYFNRDIRTKIIMLFNDFDMNHLDTSSVAYISGEYRNDCLELMKSKLKYLIDLKYINDFDKFFIECGVNELFSCVELYTECIQEIINRYERHQQSELFSMQRYDTRNIFLTFIKSFNELLDYHKIPYQFTYNKILDKLFIENKFNEIEEENKKEFFNIVNDEKVNEYFTNALIAYTQKKYPDAIENSYLTLERFLKIITRNTDANALDCYSELQKKEFKGIFNLSEFKTKIKNQIACSYGLRSKLKSHSPNEKFDEKEFLQETAKFQVNEVMNLCILLNEIVKK